MNTVNAFENDVLLQPGFITQFRPLRPIERRKQSDVLFCGSGDSLAAAMLASSFSDYAVRSVDPLELLQNRQIAKGKKVYFVSVSGNTRANVEAAKTVRNSVAITKNPHSRLARTCKSRITLDYGDSGVLTSGSIGFVASALTCISLVTPIMPRNAFALMMRAKKAAQKIRAKNRVYFLGNQYTYPVSVYATAKLCEVVGHDAQHERLEQFFHMGLFGTRKKDTVVIFDESVRAKKMERMLRMLGLTVHRPLSGTRDDLGRILFYTFVSQFVALNAARKDRQKECYFILQDKIRSASSQMIY